MGGGVGRKNPAMALRNFKHGGTGHRFFETYRHMIARCHNPRSKDYPRYGGRGIFVCDEWRLDVWAFLRWGDAKNPPAGLTLDRENNDGPYSPENCTFSTAKEQLRNTRLSIFVLIDGKQVHLIEAVEHFGVVKYQTAWSRIKRRGWDPLSAVSIAANIGGN
jgi:hypothetical protein